MPVHAAIQPAGAITAAAAAEIQLKDNRYLVMPIQRAAGPRARCGGAAEARAP